MSKKKLKPCPLCGGKAKLSKTEGDDRIIECKKCELALFDDMKWENEEYDAEENVIKKWNTRLSED